jgi:hypothetical protein
MKGKRKLVKLYIMSTVFYGSETCTLRKVDQKYLESYDVWYWRRMEISWSDRVRNEEVLHRLKQERNILHAVKRRKANWIGHILYRNCLLRHFIEEKAQGSIEVTKRGR